MGRCSNCLKFEDGSSHLGPFLKHARHGSRLPAGCRRGRSHNSSTDSAGNNILTGKHYKYQSRYSKPLTSVAGKRGLAPSTRPHALSRTRRNKEGLGFRVEG